MHRGRARCPAAVGTPRVRERPPGSRTVRRKQPRAGRLTRVRVLAVELCRPWWRRHSRSATVAHARPRLRRGEHSGFSASRRTQPTSSRTSESDAASCCKPGPRGPPVPLGPCLPLWGPDGLLLPPSAVLSVGSRDLAIRQDGWRASAAGRRGDDPGRCEAWAVDERRELSLWCRPRPGTRRRARQQVLPGPSES